LPPALPTTPPGHRGGQSADGAHRHHHWAGTRLVEHGPALARHFEAPDGTILDGSHVHRTANGELVISKSEVIVANTLRSLGVEYVYEQPLVMPDGTRRLPDFTIPRLGKPTVYWEHLGMLGSAGYCANWEAKRAWYASHGTLPWTEDGGPNGMLVWSVEGAGGDGIDAEKIEQLARTVLDIT
jgi:hypothetical protein